MKKVLLYMVCVCMLLTVALSGCGASGDSKNPAPQVTPTEAASNNENIPSTYITKEKTELRFVANQPGDVEDFNTNEFTKWVEEQTNVHIVWETIPNAVFKEKFNLLLASGDYPDVFFNCAITPDQEIQYGNKEGVFLPLNDLIDQYGVETKRIFGQLDWLKGYITSPDGNIYSLPTYSSILHVDYAQKYWINTTWLEKLNLKMPTTTDEFYNVLKAFKTSDINGNGIQDEIPLTGSEKEWHSAIYPFLVSAFILDEGIYSEHLTLSEDGKIDTIFNKEEYREALRYMNKLYKEGLIYEGTFTQQNDQLKQLGEKGLIGVGAGGGAIMFLSSNNSPYYKEYATIPPLKGPNGVQVTPVFKYGDVRLGQYAISTECKNPEVAFKLADFYYSYDATMRFRFGVKDLNWREATADEKGLDGRPAKYVELGTTYTGGVQNNHYGNAGLFFETNDMWTLERAFDQNADLLDPLYMQQYLHMESVSKYVPYGSKTSVPPARYLPEEQSEVSLLKTEIKSFTDQSRVRFITGDLDVDKDWAKYVQDLEKMGVARYIELYQKAYDRQFKN